jgi:sarcosine oxidase subunit gamma
MSDFGVINLRGDTCNASFLTAVATVLDQELPVKSNAMSIAKHRIYWLGPDEWLIVTPKKECAGILARLHEALANLSTALNDVSGGYVLLRLSGKNTREVLAKGCTLDFHPDVFPIEQCAQSGLAKATVLIGHIDDDPSYEVIVRRSFSEYLCLWLQSVGAEHGTGFSIR